MTSSQVLRVAGRSFSRRSFSQSSNAPSTAVIRRVSTRFRGSRKSSPSQTAPRSRGDHGSKFRSILGRPGGKHAGKGTGEAASERPRAGRYKNPRVEGEASAANDSGHCFGFAFDIDGVLMHASKPIPGAGETLRYLQSERIPFILLTNGGGKLESERALELSQALDVRIDEGILVQSHTPWKQLVHAFEDRVKCPEGMADKTILVTGSDPGRCREIAESYGFKNVVIPADILAAQPSIWPFDPLMGPVSRSVRPLPKPIYTPSGGVEKNDCLQFSAVFIFNDPRDWAFDLQLIADLVMSEKGILGTVSQTTSRGRGHQPDELEVYFSQSDLLWSTDHHMPRFGQGAFLTAALAVWGKMRVPGTRTNLSGKPGSYMFAYAERILRDHHQQLRNPVPVPPLQNVYMVGDNVMSDIVGANSFKSRLGSRWNSILVRTGLAGSLLQVKTNPSHSYNSYHVPNKEVKDVKEAVQWALRKQGLPGHF